MIKSVEKWKNYSKEFDNQTTVIELIQKYINCYSLKQIDSEYLKICKPLVSNSEISNRQLREIENFANCRPMMFNNLYTIKTKVQSYGEEIKNGFKEYAKDIGMDIESLTSEHLELLFKLTFLCLAGEASEDSNFRKKFGLKKNLWRKLINLLK